MTPTTPLDEKQPESDEAVIIMNVPRWRAGVGAVSLLLFAGYLIEAISLTTGTLRSPGPGMFPTIVGMGGIIAAGLVVVEALRASAATATLPKGRQARDAIFFVVGLVAAVLLLPVLGMYTVAPVYTAVTAWVLAERHRWRGATIGAVVALGSCILLSELLDVRLPAGIW